MSRNAFTVIALGVALATIAVLALISLGGRDEDVASVPEPQAISPTRTPAPAAGTTTRPARDETLLTRGVVPSPTHDAQYTIHGTLHAIDGRVVADADVRVELVIGDAERVVLGETISDVHGRFTVRNAAPLQLDPARRALGVVRAMASAEGFRPASVDAALATDADEQTLELVLDPGGRLAGRVLRSDETGRPGAQPVEGAEVSLVVSADVSGREELTAAQTTRTDPDGRFELGFLSSGTVAVQVRAHGEGSALVRDVRLVAGSDRELGDLLLAGRGTLEGTVTYPGGDPARQLTLWAVPAELAGRPHALALARKGELKRELGDGLTLDHTKTNDAGHFRFAGLAAGNYTLVTERNEQTLAPSDSVHATGSQAIALMLGARRLRVLVRAADGSPLSGAKVSVTPMTEDDRGVRISGRAQQALARGADGACDFEVPANSPLALRVTSPGCHPVDERIELTETERERVHTVVLHPATSQGTVQLDVRDSSGRAFESLRVWVLAESTSLPVAGFDGITPDDERRIGPLPPGRYGLVVWPLSYGAADEPGTAFPIETEAPIEVSASGETYVALVAQSGGRVHLTLDVPSGHEIAVDPDEDQYGQITRRRRAARRLREHGAQVTFTDASGQVRAVHFESEGGLEMLLLPGTGGRVSDLFEPGRWTVEVNAPGFREATTSVEILPGELQELNVALVPY